MRPGVAAILAGVAYLALAVLQTWPLTRHLGTHLTGEGLGDNVSFVWNLWWMREALGSPASFFFSPAVLSPLGAPLILHTHTAALAWIAATVLSSFTIVEAQNLLLIGSLALNGWSVHLLAYTVTRRLGASFVAGALFLLSPVVSARLLGHFNLVAAWPLVLACLAFVAWWRRPVWWRGLCLGVSCGALPFFDYYYCVYFGVFAAGYAAMACIRVDVCRDGAARRRAAIVAGALAVACFSIAIAIASGLAGALAVMGLSIRARTPTNALTAAWWCAAAASVLWWRWRVRLASRKDERPALRAVALPLMVAALLVVPLVSPAWRLWRSGAYVTQQSGLRSGPRGVDVGTLVLGPPFNGAVGASVRRTYARLQIDPMESAAWLGWGVLGLAGLAWWRRGDDPDVRRWLGAGAIFAVWALGPYLMLFGRNTGLLLPGALLRVVPIVNNARIPGRALVMVAVCACVLSACALAGARSRRRSGLAIALVALAIVESLAAPLPIVPLPDAGVYARLAGAPGGAVLPVPFGLRDGFGERGHVEPDAMYQQTVHRHPVAGGFVARLPPDAAAWYLAHEPFATVLRLSEGQAPLQAAGCDAIRSGLDMAGVTYVVMYADAPAPLRQFVTTAMPVESIAADGGRELFRVTACRQPRD